MVYISKRKGKGSTTSYYVLDTYHEEGTKRTISFGRIMPSTLQQYNSLANKADEIRCLLAWLEGVVNLESSRPSNVAQEKFSNGNWREGQVRKLKDHPEYSPDGAQVSGFHSSIATKPPSQELEKGGGGSGQSTTTSHAISAKVTSKPRPMSSPRSYTTLEERIRTLEKKMDALEEKLSQKEEPAGRLYSPRNITTQPVNPLLLSRIKLLLSKHGFFPLHSFLLKLGSSPGWVNERVINLLLGRRPPVAVRNGSHDIYDWFWVDRQMTGKQRLYCLTPEGQEALAMIRSYLSDGAIEERVRDHLGNKNGTEHIALVALLQLSVDEDSLDYERLTRHWSSIDELLFREEKQFWAQEGLFSTQRMGPTVTRLRIHHNNPPFVLSMVRDHLDQD